jgi:signal transduction histidine kinase/DNA-binding response OmpR family regulator
VTRSIVILVVEDDEASARLVRELLRDRRELLLEHASSLGEATARLAQGGVDLVILDLGLPDSQGLQTFERLSGTFPDTAVVVLTGRDDEETAAQAVKRGAQDYLPKGRVDGLLLTRSILHALERKRVARSLEESERRLRAAQRLARVGDWDFDPATGTISWSDTVYDLYERDPALGPPSAADEAQYYPEATAERLRSLSARALEQGEPYDTDFPVALPSKRPAFFRAVGAPVRDGSGRIVKVTGTIQDITDLKQAQLQILELNADLERRVAQRTAELEVANRELEAFAYSVSHDLRAPLRAIDGFTRATLEDCRATLGPVGEAHLERVRAAARRMSVLIDDLLALSRVTTAPLTTEEVDLSALATGIAEALLRSDPARTVEFVIEPALAATGDASLLRVALENLLGNAWKFTSKQERARIELRRIEHDGRPAFVVHDDGVGFDMAYADRLFAPFQRLHDSSEFEGTGVGLATVQRIVRRHGGAVWAEGKRGGGASFFFSLPGLPGPADPPSSLGTS